MTDLASVLEFLRDGVWQSVGAVLALVGLAVALYIYRGQAKYKEVSTGTISSRSVVEVDGEIAEQLEVTYSGKKVNSAGMSVLVLRCTGNLPILATDFIKPISVTFPDGTQVLSALVYREWPKNLEAKLETAASEVYIAPLLLNPLDALELQILTSPSGSQPTVTLSAIDVPKLERLEFIGSSTSATISRYIPYVMCFLLAPILASMPIVFKAFPDSRLIPFTILLQTLVMFALISSRIIGQFGRKGRRLFRDA